MLPFRRFAWHLWSLYLVKIFSCLIVYDNNLLFMASSGIALIIFTGKRLFEELDTDGDGHVTLEDLEIAMEKRKLPRRHGHQFMTRYYKYDHLNFHLSCSL